MIKINLDGLRLENRVEATSIEIIHQDRENLRINILDRDGMMLTRIEVGVEDDTVMLKTWMPDRWVENDPHNKYPLAHI